MITPVRLDTAAAFETPEHFFFEIRLAGPTRRAAAYAIDAAIRGFVLGVLAILVVLSSTGDAIETMSTGALLLVVFVLEWGYFVVFEFVWSGQTPGKRVLGLRVVKDGGYPIQGTDILLRNLLRAADFMPLLYVTGFMVAMADPRFRRLGDLVAGTVVVQTERELRGLRKLLARPPSEVDLDTIPAHVVLTGDEYAAIETLLLRLGTLSRAREEELAALLATPLATRLGTPPAPSAVRFLALVYWRATRLRQGPHDGFRRPYE